MRKNNRQVLAFFINATLLIFLFTIRYTGFITLKIGQAVPITLIPFVLAISIFYGEGKGLLTGLIAGALMDCVMTSSSVFNTLLLMFIGVVGGILASHYLNRNLKSALVLSIGGSFFYLFMRMTVFYSFKGIFLGSEYFAMYFIPSVFYTAIFIIPFYYLEKKLITL